MSGGPLRVDVIGSGGTGEAGAPDFALCEQVALGSKARRAEALADAVHSAPLGR